MADAREGGAAIADLKRRIGPTATAIVGRDGVARAADLPDAMHAESYTMRGATAMGTAGAALAAVGRGAPEWLVRVGPDTRTVLGALGPTEFLAVTGGPVRTPLA